MVVLLVILVVVVGLAVVVDRSFAVQAGRNADELVTARAQLARQLARGGVGPQQLVNRVGSAGTRAGLVLPDGATYGEPLPLPGVAHARTIRLAAAGELDGATLEIGVDHAVLDRTQRALRRSLLLAGLLALVVGAVLAAVVLRLALRPLDAFAVLARDVTSGQRGARLRPSRPDTELGRAALAVDVMLDELEQAERRTREFLADAAHELRTPAAGIGAAAESLLHQSDSLSEAEREQLLVLLVREAQRTGRLTADLLAAASLDAGLTVEVVPVDLGQLIRGEVERTALLHPAMTLRTLGSLAPDGPPVQVLTDPVRVRSIVANLLTNAARAAGPAGHIDVVGGRDDGWATVLVTDDGPGVPAAERERVFERLVRLDTHRSRGDASDGAGLGLAIGRGYARALGGELRCVEPPVGVTGAAFLLRLPGVG